MNVKHTKRRTMEKKNKKFECAISGLLFKNLILNFENVDSGLA